jgi:hypothetical protein
MIAKLFPEMSYLLLWECWDLTSECSAAAKTCGVAISWKNLSAYSTNNFYWVHTKICKTEYFYLTPIFYPVTKTKNKNCWQK